MTMNDKLMEKLSNLLDMKLQPIKEKLASIEIHIGNLHHVQLESTSNTLRYQSDNVGNKVQDLTEDNFNEVQDQSKTISNKVQDQSEASNKVQDQGKASKKVQDFSENVDDKVHDQRENVSDKVQDQSENVGDEVQDQSENVGDEVQDQSGNNSNKAQGQNETNFQEETLPSSMCCSAEETYDTISKLDKSLSESTKMKYQSGANLKEKSLSGTSEADIHEFIGVLDNKYNPVCCNQDSLNEINIQECARWSNLEPPSTKCYNDEASDTISKMDRPLSERISNRPLHRISKLDRTLSEGSIIMRKHGTLGKEKVKSHTSELLAPERVRSDIQTDPNDKTSFDNFPFKQLDYHVNNQQKLESLKQSVELIARYIIGPNAIFVGSSYENLSVGLPYEFDIQWPIIGEYKFENITQKSDISVYDVHKNTMITPASVRDVCSTKLIQNICKCQGNLPSGWKYFDNKANKCLVTHRKGFQVGMCVEDGNTMVGVLLDVIPCIKLPAEFTETVLDQTAVKKINQLVDDGTAKDIKDIKLNDLYLVFNNTSWKVSTSLTENVLLNQLDDELKIPLRVIKYFLRTFIVQKEPLFSSDIYGYHHLIPSFILKNEYMKMLLDGVLGGGKETAGNVVSHLIRKLEKCYAKSEAQRTQNLRNFLLVHNEVQVMFNSNISEKLKQIKTQLTYSKELVIDTKTYPLLNSKI